MNYEGCTRDLWDTKSRKVGIIKYIKRAGNVFFPVESNIILKIPIKLFKHQNEYILWYKEWYNFSINFPSPLLYITLKILSLKL